MVATYKKKQWNAQNIMAFSMSQTHSEHIHLTSHHYISHHITSNHITHTKGCQHDLGIPLILMDIEKIPVLIRQNALTIQTQKRTKRGG
jgi:hypothetical protein